MTPDTPDTTPDTSDHPRIYVADLAAYNAGRLRGTWIDLSEYATDDRDVSELLAAIDSMLLGAPTLHPFDRGEEWAIHDSENLPKCLRGEYVHLADLVTYAYVAAESPYDAPVVAAWYDWVDRGEWTGDYADTIIERINESYVGEGPSSAEIVWRWHEDSGALIGEELERWERFIDWNMVADEWEMEGYYFAHLDYSWIVCFRPT